MEPVGFGKMPTGPASILLKPTGFVGKIAKASLLKGFVPERVKLEELVVQEPEAAGLGVLDPGHGVTLVLFPRLLCPMTLMLNPTPRSLESGVGVLTPWASLLMPLLKQFALGSSNVPLSVPYVTGEHVKWKNVEVLYLGYCRPSVMTQ
jgi:hypothetical protein